MEIARKSFAPNSGRAVQSKDGKKVVLGNTWMRDHIRESSGKKIRTRMKREAQAERIANRDERKALAKLMTAGLLAYAETH